MHVGLNLLHLVPGETGGSEIYARRLVPALLAARPSLRLSVFAGYEAFPSLREERWVAEVELVRIPVAARSRVRRVLAEQTLLPGAVRRARVGLLHNLFNTAPVAPGAPQVTTILDVTYKHFPETQPALLAHGLALLVPLAARRSTRVLTISHAAKEDVVRFLGVDAERVDVTHLGPGMPDGVEPVAEGELRRRFALGDRPVVLSVSAKRPHKNLERLIEAVARVSTPGPPVLVLPGYPTFFEPRLRALAASVADGDRVRFTGWVDDTTLEGLYRAATCLVFPSLAEGFGLPVLEAMRRGLPVTCSDASSLPEVAGDAALLFDPTDTDAIAGAVTRLLTDGDLRERLRRLGLERARQFSWEATAAGTLASYERAVAEASSRS